MHAHTPYRALAALLILFLAALAPGALTSSAAVERLRLGTPAHPYPLTPESDCVIPGDLESHPLSAMTEIGAGRARLRLRLADGESLHGLGAWFLDWNLRGRVFETWIQDRIHGGRGSSYFAAPFFVSSKGYGCFVNCTGRVRFDFGQTHPDEIVIEAPEEGLDVFLFRGTPSEVVRAYTAIVGRPPTVPDWVFRLWISRNSYLSAAEIEDILARCAKEDIPVGCVVMEAWAEMLQSFTFESDRYPDPAKWLASLRARGVAPVLWITPSTWTASPIYPLARDRGFLVLGPDGNELTLDWLEGARKINFDNPDARDWWTGLARNLVEMGVAGFKTDGGERNPDPFFHNLQPFHYQESTLRSFDGSGHAGVTFARSASAVSTRTGTFWAGDQHAEWDSLGEAVRAGLGAGLSGFAYYGHDIGGYLGDPSPELYIRWFQLGTFSPIMQWHGIPAREPWEFGTEATRLAGYYSRLRERLLPYLRATAQQAVATGTPIWRPMAWVHPEDAAAWNIDDQFYLGEDLLVAPILAPGGRRTVRLPAGRWVDLFTAETHEGPTRIDYPAPIEHIPVFVPEARWSRWVAVRGEAPVRPQPGLRTEQIAPTVPGGLRTVQHEQRPDGRAVVAWDLRNTSSAPIEVHWREHAEPGLAITKFPASSITLGPGERRRIARFLELAPDARPGWAYAANFEFASSSESAPAAATFRLSRPLKWRVAGPFSGRVRSPDRSIDPAAPLSDSSQWRDCPPEALQTDGTVNLARAFGREPEGSYYALATLTAPHSGPALVRVGSGDALSLWVNGRLVHDHAEHGNHSLHSRSAEITLQEGENSLLVRLTRQIGPAAFSLRVEAPLSPPSSTSQ